MKIKKKYLFIGLSLAMCFVGCSDDDFTNGFKRPVSGDEVVFGTGTGEFNIDPKQQPKGGTRTVYVAEGEQNFKNYSFLSVEWQKDDQVRIFSPQAETGYKTADYTVISKEGDADDMVYKNGFLVKVGDTGIRWGATTETHNFYAFYPTTVKSHNMITGLQTDTKVRAEIPVAQEHGKLYTYDQAGNESSGDVEGDWKIIAPDMSFAMMVAEAEYNPSTSTKSTIALNFKPIVTVLDVAINGPQESGTSYKILQVNVYSEGEQAIVGPFTYDFSKSEEERFNFDEVDAASADYKLATVDCMYNQEALELKTGQILNVKFFLLPRDIKAGDLTVSILLEGGRVIEKKLDNNASLNISDIILKQGKIIKIKTPYLPADVKTNNWMSLIDDNVYFASQLSLPGTKQSYTYTMVDRQGNLLDSPSLAGGMDENRTPTINYSGDVNKLRMQVFQTLTIAEQFNAGVRAFQTKIDWVNGKACVYVAGNPIEIQLNEVLRTLKGLVRPDGVSPEKFTEGVVLSIDYVGRDSASDWLANLVSIIQDWNNGEGENIVQPITAYTTMLEMRGKIGIMIHFPEKNPSTASSVIGIIQDYNTTVQSREIRKLQIGTSGTIHVQNLLQVNNPDIKEQSINGVHAVYGLLPRYAHRGVEKDEMTDADCDLLTKKHQLVKQLFDDSRINNTEGNDNVKIQNLYVNDLSGFCVVDDYMSTGWATVTVQERSLFGWSSHTEQVRTKKDLQDAYTYYQETQPSRAERGDTWCKPSSFDDDGWTRGEEGNQALFSQEVNKEANDLIYNFVNEGRTPLGIVYMNYAGLDKITIGTKTYEVKSVTLPSLIISNNFKFPLIKKQQ